ncbi:MAG TPA: phosphoglucosamine mutase [Candidatus Limnocylindrales bacterium]|nr:phosphoglucosamine mutase [Candidatus Limnocylindrales bacterium]
MGRFGTDGIRGAVGTEITVDLALRLGHAVGRRFGGPGRAVVLGRDPRRSGEMLTAALTAGLTATGTDVVDLGLVTTPCLVHASRDDAFVAGVMVSASHNPAPDNGLKVVVDGRKAGDAAEGDLERLIDEGAPMGTRPNAELGRVRRDRGAADAYRRQLVEVAGDAFAGLRIGVDCANGSASVIAPDLFRALGAEVTVLFDAPDGTNINDGCGSTHPERLAETVAAAGLDLGLAFDGDADRLIAVDETGAIVDGDAVMGICALERLSAGTLRNNVLVATVMSNGGLERAVTQAGGRMVRTPVGDRHVLEAMEREDAVLGGEQSGHIIFRDRSSTGDGLMTAIELVRALRAAGRPLSALAGRIPRLPQVVINSAVARRDGWRDDPEFAAAIERATERMGDRGRVLVRPSGTEPKIRIMVEGDDAGEIDEVARELATLAEARLN